MLTSTIRSVNGTAAQERMAYHTAFLSLPLAVVALKSDDTDAVIETSAVAANTHLHAVWLPRQTMV